MAKNPSSFGGSAREARFALLIATLGLIVNFWAWSILSPLGTRLQNELVIGTFSLSLLLAIPVIVGSLGRIPVGIATDKIGGKNMFAFVCLLASAPLFGLAFLDTYSQIMVAAFLLGISGTAFAIGIPYISSWFPPQKRGFALGVYSMGNAGTAISGFLTPRLDDSIGRQWAFTLVAILLILVAFVFLMKGKNSPSWKPAKGSSAKRLAEAAKSRITWDLSSVYILTFGAFVAFGVYLPVLLKVSFQLTITDAASRAAGFILLATLARPFGGWLSDKLDGRRVIRFVLLAIALLAAFVAFQPSLSLQTTIAYLSLAFFLGCGNGAVFALVGKLSKSDNIGSVTGIVGALGGLGGFFPPLVLGLTYQATKSYALALILLALTSLVVFIYINKRFKDKCYRPARR